LVAEEVSRNHAIIKRKCDKTILYDLNSLNGTYVNRERVKERVIAHLDEIWFGSKCHMTYRDDTNYGAKAEAAPTAEKMRDSQVVRNVDKIRAEMESVGNSMTLIGKLPSKEAQEQAAPSVGDSTKEESIVQMSRAYRRLAAIHKISQIIASNFDLKDRLAKVLDVVLEILSAERGFVMLREDNSDKLTVKVAREMGKELQSSSPSMGIAGRAAIDGEPVLMVDQSEDKEFGARASIIMGRIVSAMCVPLLMEGRPFGSIYVDTRNPMVRFTEEDLELFNSLAAQSAIAIDNVRLHDRMVEAEKKRQNLGRFLSPAIVDKIMGDGADLTLGGQKTMVTVMFCDIRKSSQLAERLQPQELVSLLNEHFTAMSELIFTNQGTLDKYIGDEIMALFGAPLATDDDAFNAVKAAIEIQAINKDLNALRKREGRPILNVGIGINTGEVIAGYLGSPTRMEFTVVGDHVNTSKRFCDMAGEGQIIIGQQTYDRVKERIQAKPTGTVMLKGKEKAVHAFEVLGLNDPMAATLIDPFVPLEPFTPKEPLS